MYYIKVIKTVEDFCSKWGQDPCFLDMSGAVDTHEHSSVLLICLERCLLYPHLANRWIVVFNDESQMCYLTNGVYQESFSKSTSLT